MHDGDGELSEATQRRMAGRLLLDPPPDRRMRWSDVLAAALGAVGWLLLPALLGYGLARVLSR